MAVRVCEPTDVPRIIQFIKDLAAYELQPQAVVNSVEELTFDLFVEKCCFALVFESENLIKGFALYYFGYSTWKGRTLYLEDIFVDELYRKEGIGQKLFDKVVQVAKTEKVRRMDWQVLEWNEPALQFYRKNNAILDNEWTNGRLFF